MHTVRFGRKLSLPSTIAIKHQFRMFMAREGAEGAVAEGSVLRGQPSPAVSSVTPMSEIDANALSGRIRP
jgi:hypothetical protein